MAAMGDRQDDWMVVGRVAGPFGVRGELKVDLQTDFPDRFAHLVRVYLGPDRTEFQVERSRRHGERTLLKLSGVDAPEQVQNLQGQEVCVPRSEAVPLPEGHYYLDDLLGMTVLTVDGKALGHVSEVLRTGANDVYVVNDGRATILVPGTQEAVRLDLERRTVVVEPWVLQPHD